MTSHDPSPPAANAPLVLHASRKTFVVLLCLCLALTACAAFVLATGRADTGRSDVVPWLAVAVFGVGAALAAWQLLDRRPRIVADDEGLFDRTLGIGRIPWNAITDAHLGVVLGRPFLWLSLADPDEWTRRLPLRLRIGHRASRRLVGGDLHVNLTGIDGDAVGLFVRIRLRVDRTSGRQPARVTE